MRRLRYSVATSLDGYIADVDGGYDWITHEPTIDFGAYFAKIDTFLMGRGTWEVAKAGSEAQWGNKKIYVVSTTLPADGDPRITVIGSDVEARVRELKSEPGRDIWLFGGGVLFRSLLRAGLVDRVEVGITPVLLGDGIPLLPALPAHPGPVRLSLHSSEVFPSGIVLLKYDVENVIRRPAQ